MEESKLTVCRNPWCKATFQYYTEAIPEICPKCKSFDRDLSGGVTWTDKKYDGPRFDGLPHRTSINVKKYSHREISKVHKKITRNSTLL